MYIVPLDGPDEQEENPTGLTTDLLEHGLARGPGDTDQNRASTRSASGAAVGCDVGRGAVHDFAVAQPCCATGSAATDAAVRSAAASTSSVAGLDACAAVDIADACPHGRDATAAAAASPDRESAVAATSATP